MSCSRTNGFFFQDIQGVEAFSNKAFAKKLRASGDKPASGAFTVKILQPDILRRHKKPRHKVPPDFAEKNFRLKKTLKDSKMLFQNCFHDQSDHQVKYLKIEARKIIK